MRLALIVASSENGVIGRGNALPWRIPEDLQYFKRVTMGKPVVMGRKTFESIGRPLPGRSNIVISRGADCSAQGVRVVASLEEAVRLAESIALVDGTEEAIVIGGAQIYALALDRVQRLYMTEVHAEFDGDTFLPDVNWGEWRELHRERRTTPTDGPDYSFVVYDRASG
ncbi:MAG: dihydrofolate reductase [Pseudomonadota bacterium]